MVWDYLSVSCSLLNGPERRLKVLQSLGTFDQDTFELFSCPEVTQRDLFAVVFQRNRSLVCLSETRSVTSGLGCIQPTL